MRGIPSPRLAAGPSRRSGHAVPLCPEQAGREDAFICLKAASPALSSWAPLGKIWRASFLPEAFQQTGSPALGRGKGFLTWGRGAEQSDSRADLAKDAMENQQPLCCRLSPVFWAPPAPLQPLPLPPPRPGRPLPGRSRRRLGDAPERPAQSLLQLGSGLLVPPNNDPSGVEPVAEGCGTIKAGNETLGRCVFIAL